VSLAGKADGAGVGDGVPLREAPGDGDVVGVGVGDRDDVRVALGVDNAEIVAILKVGVDERELTINAVTEGVAVPV
jgi:hypothetical protein